MEETKTYSQPSTHSEEKAYPKNWMGIINPINHQDQTHTKHKLTNFASLICTQGEGTLHINNQKVQIRQNDLLICQPGTLIENGTLSKDFSYCGLYLSTTFLNSLDNIPTNVWNIRMHLEQHPLIHLSNEAGKIYCQYYELIRAKLQAAHTNAHQRFITTCLTQAFLYEFYIILEQYLHDTPLRFTSGDNIFKKFIDLLLQTYPKPRSVNWYANMLHVTPKYLSTICKHSCGETASYIINHYVINDVKRLLMRPEKTIKEIVSELNFPSISFFGKYVKKHLGVSPKFYRKGLIP